MEHPERDAILRERLRAEVPVYRAPESLRARVQALACEAPQGAKQASFAPRGASEASSMAPRWRAAPWNWLTAGALAGCAATLGALFAIDSVRDWRRSEDVVAQALEDHVLANRENRLFEVASSDQHTVKPWLSARLDYSPPVRDYADEGFPLLGGRLETLHGQRVATLVYRHRMHTISVGVRPAPDPSIPALRSERGFQVAHASAPGIDCIAVSDLNAEELSAFVQRLAQAGATP